MKGLFCLLIISFCSLALADGEATETYLDTILTGDERNSSVSVEPAPVQEEIFNPEILNEFSNAPKEIKEAAVVEKSDRQKKLEEYEQIKVKEESLRKDLFDVKVKKETKSLNSDKVDAIARESELQEKIKVLIEELKEARNRLMLAEAEVERLSGILEQQYQRVLRTDTSDADEEIELPKYEAKTTEEMEVATVTVDKAHLRAGPSKDNSPIMSVSKGTRLAVETRDGEWYRVVTPTGARAWIAGEVVHFGKDINSSPDETVQVGAYDEELDAAAVKLIKESMEKDKKK